MYIYKLWFSSRPMPRSGITISYGSSDFSFLSSLHTVLHRDCTNLHSHQQCVRICFSAHPLQHLLCEDILTVVILTSVKLYIIVVFSCISLVVSDVEHLFMYLLAICMSSWKKCLFRTSSHVLLDVCYLIQSCISCLYVLDIKPLLIASFANIFSQSVGCLFIMFMVSFAVQKLVSLIRFHLLIFGLSLWPWETHYQILIAEMTT